MSFCVKFLVSSGLSAALHFWKTSKKSCHTALFAVETRLLRKFAWHVSTTWCKTFSTLWEVQLTVLPEPEMKVFQRTTSSVSICSWYVLSCASGKICTRHGTWKSISKYLRFLTDVNMPLFPRFLPNKFISWTATGRPVRNTNRSFSKVLVEWRQLGFPPFSGN